MLVGYARVSTADQDPALQLDALEKVGCERVFEERASGARSDRPVLSEAMDYVREGDVLVVCRLDRFGRSLKDLISNVERLRERGLGSARSPRPSTRRRPGASSSSTSSGPSPSSSGS